jgi:hypothetical protein
MNEVTALSNSRCMLKTTRQQPASPKLDEGVLHPLLAAPSMHTTRLHCKPQTSPFPTPIGSRADRTLKGPLQPTLTMPCKLSHPPPPPVPQLTCCWLPLHFRAVVDQQHMAPLAVCMVQHSLKMRQGGGTAVAAASSTTTAATTSCCRCCCCSSQL